MTRHEAKICVARCNQCLKSRTCGSVGRGRISNVGAVLFRLQQLVPALVAHPNRIVPAPTGHSYLETRVTKSFSAASAVVLPQVQPIEIARATLAVMQTTNFSLDSSCSFNINTNLR